MEYSRHDYKNIIKREVKQASFYINVDAVPIIKVQRTLTLLLLLRIAFLTLPDASFCSVLGHL